VGGCKCHRHLQLVLLIEDNLTRHRSPRAAQGLRCLRRTPLTPAVNLIACWCGAGIAGAAFRRLVSPRRLSGIAESASAALRLPVPFPSIDSAGYLRQAPLLHYRLQRPVLSSSNVHIRHRAEQADHRRSAPSFPIRHAQRPSSGVDGLQRSRGPFRDDFRRKAADHFVLLDRPKLEMQPTGTGVKWRATDFNSLLAHRADRTQGDPRHLGVGHRSQQSHFFGQPGFSPDALVES
jgi:hypothetical protein